MSGVSQVTSQLNSIANCAPQVDCCDRVDDLYGAVARLTFRVQNLENGSDRDRNDLLSLLNALRGAIDQKANASDLGLLKNDFGLLEATLAALVAVVGILKAGFDSLSSAFGSLLDSFSKSNDSAQRSADEALSIARQALSQAQRAIGEAAVALATSNTATQLANTAIGIANGVRSLVDTAISQASEAFNAASSAISRANTAESKADRAIGDASAAQSTADRAYSTAGAAQGTADRAIGDAGAARSTADRAIGIAGAAQGTADRAISTAGVAQSTADRAITSANGAQVTANVAINIAESAQTTADRAIGTANGAQSTASSAAGTAGTAQSTADRAIAIASAVAANPARQGERGLTGERGIAGTAGDPGINGRDGTDGSPGFAGSPGFDGAIGPMGPPGSAGTPGATGATGATGARGADGINSPNTDNPVNPGREQEIIELIRSTQNSVLAVPEALVASQSFRAAAVSAAATGSCQSSQPGSCPGGSADQIGGLGGILNGVAAGVGLLNNAVLGTITSTLNVINTKLGSQIVGGLSSWSKGIAEVVNQSQILNVLTYISVLHNAYMLSNALSQTLFSAVGNSLAALGLKDTSTDPNGTPFNVGKIVNDWTETFFKSVFGVATVDGIKSDWKKYSRIYQAAAQVMYSLQSIGHSILGALEVVGSHVAKIGNALQKFRVVSERAFSWMNPTPSFQNRFFTGLQATQEVVSQVDQVASEVLSVQETITQLGKNNEDFMKSIGQAPDSKQAVPTPEAVKVKETAATEKAASKSPAIPDSAITKP